MMVLTCLVGSPTHALNVQQQCSISFVKLTERLIHVLSKQRVDTFISQVTCTPFQLRHPKAKLEARVQKLRLLATGCNDRELAILAVAVEDLAVKRGFDAMKDLAIIQVEPWFV